MSVMKVVGWPGVKDSKCHWEEDGLKCSSRKGKGWWSSANTMEYRTARDRPLSSLSPTCTQDKEPQGGRKKRQIIKGGYFTLEKSNMTYIITFMLYRMKHEPLFKNTVLGPLSKLMFFDDISGT